MGEIWGYINEHALVKHYCYSYHGTTAPSEPGSLHYQGCTITLKHTTLSKTPLDWWSAWRRDPYLTTQWKYSTVNIELLLTQPYMCKKLRVVHFSQNSYWTVRSCKGKLRGVGVECPIILTVYFNFEWKIIYSFTLFSVSFPCARYKKAYGRLQYSSPNSQPRR